MFCLIKVYVFYKGWRLQKLTKSSPLIWHYAVSVKSMVKILSKFVAFLENTNFKSLRSVVSIKVLATLIVKNARGLRINTSKSCWNMKWNRTLYSHSLSMYPYHCTGGFVRYSFPKLLLNKRAVAGCSTAEEFIFLTCQKGTSDENRWTVKLNFRLG